MFPVVTVPDTAALLSEQLGSKHKFWFQHESSLMYLFKEARSGTGEDWSEKVACALCHLLDLPHVHYDLAIGSAEGCRVSNVRPRRWATRARQ